MSRRRRGPPGVYARPAAAPSYVDLYWLPLGAGGHCARHNGRASEAVVALLERRARCDLYHAALEVAAEHGRHTIESTPVPPGDPMHRGVVAGGPVGARWAGRWRIFRYEVRCWRDGVIPDLPEAVDSVRSRGTGEVCCRGQLVSRRFPGMLAEVEDHHAPRLANAPRVQRNGQCST